MEGRLDEGDTCGQRRFVDGGAGSWIDEEAVVAQDFIGLVPLRETMPVVSANDEDEVAVRVGAAESFQRVDHVGGSGHVALKVADAQFVLASYG